MSGDVAYRLIVDLSTRGTLAPQFDKLAAQAKGLDSTSRKIGDSFSSAAKSAAGAFEAVGDRVVGVAASLAKIGAVGAGAALAYGVGSLNAELEKTEISLGAIFNAQGVSSNMNEGLLLAKTTLAEMRRDAAALPGELKDLQSFFKLGATPAFQAGASTERLEKLSGMGMAAAAATGVQMDQAAREFAQLLQGHAGGHNVFGQMLGLSGGKAEAFNQLSGAKRLETLEKELQKYQSSIEVFGGSFDALSSALKDNAKATLQRATAPLFDQVKKSIGEANRWYDDHRERVGQFADKVGEKLAVAFEFGKMKIYEWTPAFVAFAENARAELAKIWAAAGPMIERLEPIMKKALADPKTFDRLEHAAKLYAGIKVGGMLTPSLGSLSSLAGGLGGGGMAGALAALGPTAVVAGTALVAVGGALHAITDESALFHETASESWKQTRANFQELSDGMSKALVELKPVVTDFADIIGTATLLHLEALTTEFRAAKEVVSSFTPELFGFAEGVKMLRNAIRGDETPGPGAGVRPFADKAIEAFVRSRFAEHAQAPKTKTGAGGGGGGTHIQKVEIVLTTNQEPSRIARLTVDRIEQINRYPAMSKFQRNMAGPNR